MQTPSAPITICRLEQYATLRVSGTDAQSFLQNLLSNDIREVNASHAQYSSFNTAKGRMLATFLIWQDGNDYMLQLPASLAQSISKKLSMYVLRAKVNIADSKMAALGLAGTGQILPEACRELPAMGVMRIDELDAYAIRIDAVRCQLVAKDAESLWQKLSPKAQCTGSQEWDLHDIRSGIPTVLPATQEQFVPQMANFDLIGGVNFKKGCYPGQEIVARMHYLGKPKRRMYLAHVSCETAPLPGAELYSAEMQDQSCGMIVNSAGAPGGGYDVLAVVQIESRNGDAVHLGSLQGEKLVFGELPYPIV